MSNSEWWGFIMPFKMEGVLNWYAKGIRPHTLTASFVPILLGVILAYSGGAPLAPLSILATLLTALGIQMATNLFNDVIDGEKGTDNNRIGPKRIVAAGLAEPLSVWYAAAFTLLLSWVFALPLLYNFGVPFFLFLVVCSLLSYCYTGGPYPIAYHPWGEVFVFLFYGVFATTASCLLQGGTLSSIEILIGMQVGLLATSLILVNNIRDRNGDEKVGKNTFVVVFGKEVAETFLGVCLFTPYLLGSFLPPVVMAFQLLLLPFAVRISKKAKDHFAYRPGCPLLENCGKLHFLFGIATALGLLFV